jgi:hypothetical protein
MGKLRVRVVWFRWHKTDGLIPVWATADPHKRFRKEVSANNKRRILGQTHYVQYLRRGMWWPTWNAFR